MSHLTDIENQCYDPRHFYRLFAVEEKHFWFQARNKIISAALAPIAAELAPGFCALEVGCGTGNVLRALQQRYPQGHFFGMDLFEEGLHYARKRTNSQMVCADIRHPPFNASFEVVGLFDVLEHLPDDDNVLVTLRQVLSQSGVLLVTVPAHPSLWSYFDEASHHCRRYTIASLTATLTRAGFAVDYITPFMTFLYPLIWAVRRRTRLTSSARTTDMEWAHASLSQELRIIPGLNAFLLTALSQEARFVGKRCHLPMGTSLLAIAKKL